ncbi:MAG: phage tail tube protein [Terracidiphilus sp.]
MMAGPYNFESQKVSARNLVLTPNKQAVAGTAVATADMTRRQKFDGSAVFELKQTRYGDKAVSGKGTQFATQGLVTAWETSGGFKGDMDDYIAGWILAFLMGKDVVTGAAAPYSHAITFDETTSQACMTSIYLADTNDVLWTLIDMGVVDVTITIPARGPITFEINFIGTGHYTYGVIAAVPALPASYAYLLGSDCVFSIGASGATVSKVGRHMSTTIKISTGAVNHTAPGLGLFGAFIRTGLYKYSFQTTIAATSADDIFTLLRNDTLQEVNWTVDSGASSLVLDFPNVHLKSTKLGISGNMVVWQIEADETSILNVGGAGVLNATVVNSQPAYLVGA